MSAIFQKEAKKKGKKMLERGTKVQNILKFGQNVQNLKIFPKKGKRLCMIIACDRLLEKALFFYYSPSKYPETCY